MVLTGLAVALALVAAYARHAALDRDQFANRATAALQSDSVRALVADKVTDDVVLAHQSDLLSARPIIQSVASTVVGSRAFAGLFRAAALDTHRAVFDRDEDTVLLTVGDVGSVLAAALQQLRPQLADQVGATRRAEILKTKLDSASSTVTGVAANIRFLAWVLPVIALLLATGALVLAADRRRTVVELGIALAVAGVLVVLLYGLARSWAVHRFDGPEDRAAAGAVWDAFLSDLRSAAWLLAGAGAVLAGAASSVIRPVDVRTPLRRALDRVTTEPERPALRATRGVAFVVVGLLVALNPQTALGVLATLAGAFLVYEGVTAILRVLYRPPETAAPEVPAPPADRPRGRARRLAVPVVAGLLVLGGVSLFLGSGGTTTAAPAAGAACNGHVQLCDRPLTEIAIPATHNAMSVPLPGWFAAEQERPIAGQLADGIRGLLVDTFYADRLPGGKLRTYAGSQKKLRGIARDSGVSNSTIAAAERIRDRLGFRGKGQRGMYLCHGLCEVGGTSLSSVLDDVHDFLVANPGEVLVIVNEDYVKPADFVGAVEKAGLARMAFTPPARGPWPTLRQMLNRGKRVLIMAENKAGGAPWYVPAYRHLTEETPYEFRGAAPLLRPGDRAKSCEPNRGPKSGAPLFLINHWVSTDPTPRPSDAAKVNARAPLLARLRECARLREHRPNLVAVNFYKEGDVFGVVDEFNGVAHRR